MKLNLYLDKTREFNPKGAVFFEDENSYFNAYLKVNEAVKSDSDLTFVTHTLALKELIKSGFESYANVELIEHEEITYRILLSKRWNISYFDFTPSEKEIKEQKLLEFDFITENPETFSTLIIFNFVSPYLTGTTIPLKNFGNLLNDLNKYKTEENNLPAIVKRVVLYKSSLLLKQNPSSENLINQIFNKPIEVFNNACLFTIIQKYPTSFKEKIQNQNWTQLLKGYNLKEIDIFEFTKNSDLFLKFKDELDIYFTNLKVDLSQSSITELIDSVSGLLVEEFEFFIEILKLNSEFITNLTLKKLETKFSKLNPSSLEQLETLADNILPDFSLPEFNAGQDIKMILSDAVKYYYPYKIWSDNTGNYDNKIFQWGKLFSEYMLYEYEKLSYHFDNFIHRFIHNKNQTIKQSELVIILVVDNLNYKYFKYLQEAFSKYNIILPNEPEPYLSLLPTTTSVGKFSIISGTRDKIDSTKTTYEPIINDTWKNYFPEHSLFYYHSNLSNISHHQVNGKEIIFINYLGIDEELHSSPQKTLINHKENVKLNLEKLSKILDQFIKKNRKEDVVKIFFISDHGSTLIPKSYPNPIDDINIKNLLPDADITSDHRFIKLNNKKEFDLLKNNVNVSDTIFCLNSQISGDGSNYAIAKGYGRFKKCASDAYVHGGASPEEMIVPGGYFVFQKTKFKEVIIQLPKNEFRLMILETFAIRLGNPNDKPIEKIQIEIFENETPKIKLYDIEDIPAKGELSIEAKFKLNKKDNSKIRISINYVIDSKSITLEKEFPVKIKSMVERGIDLDKLLDL